MWHRGTVRRKEWNLHTNCDSDQSGSKSSCEAGRTVDVLFQSWSVDIGLHHRLSQLNSCWPHSSALTEWWPSQDLKCVQSSTCKYPDKGAKQCVPHFVQQANMMDHVHRCPSTIRKYNKACKHLFPRAEDAVFQCPPLTDQHYCHIRQADLDYLTDSYTSKYD